MELQTSYSPAMPSWGMMLPPSEPRGIEAVTLRHLKTSSEIESVLHLREEIDLSVHASASSNFAALEKKETNWGLSAHSSWTGTS